MLNENMVELNRNHFADNRDILKTIPDKSINLFLEDMPYNTTACDWEYEVDLKEYWELRLPKLADNGVFVLTGSQPFITDLINSNRKMFKYEWIWDKCRPTGFQNVKHAPMRQHEIVLIFYMSCNYNRQFTEKHIINQRVNRIQTSKINEYSTSDTVRNLIPKFSNEWDDTKKNPATILKYSNPNYNKIHPTEKPVGLFSYLIKTYTNENDIVFDGYSGSGTTAIACIRNNRKYIICENKKEYFDLQTKRILEEIDKTSLFNSLGGRQDRISA